MQYASTDLLHVLMDKYDNKRTIYLRYTEELTHLAQSIETDVCGAKVTGKDAVLHVGNLQPRRETWACYNCNKVGHIAADCRGKKNKGGGNSNGRGVHMTLAVVNDKETVGLVDTLYVMSECLKIPAIVTASACCQMNNRYV